MNSTPIKDKQGNIRWHPVDPVTGKPDLTKLHRTDGPAFEGANGSKEWYINDQLHRTDGPAYEWADGGKAWWVNNQRHRTDGPACEWADGSKGWYVNNKLHRTDGPACEWADGGKLWWLEGKELTEKEWKKQSARYRTLIGKLRGK